MKKVLILNASHNDVRMIQSLKQLGYYVVSSGNAPDLPGHLLCDEYIAADYSDKEAILNLSKKIKIDYICACCNDFGVLTASYVAEKLGLSGYDSYHTTQILHNKDLFKSFAQEHDILTPKAIPFTNINLAKSYIEYAQFPIMIKAVDLSAGNGIRKANNLVEGLSAIDYAFNASRSKRILIESFVEGTQHGFCTFLINQKVVAYCSNNEYSFVNPYRVEIDTFPADNEDLVSNILINTIEKIANILNLHDGIFHLQYITDSKNIPYIIECMRRVPGGLYTIPAENVSGINWDYWEVRSKCTTDLSDFPQMHHCNHGFYSYKCIMANENGTIEKITLDPILLSHQYGKWTLKNIGDPIIDYRSTPIEYIFTKYDSMEQMINTLINNYHLSHVSISK